LKFLKWVLAFAVLTSMASITAISLALENASVVIGAQVAVIGVVGIVTELLMAYADLNLRSERDELRKLWSARHEELEEIASRDDLTQLRTDDSSTGTSRAN
jgi:hypothetical protein